MQFSSVPIAHAVGHILGHNITYPDGRRALRKGRTLTQADVALLAELNRTTVYVAQLAADDVAEDDAARRVANAVSHPTLTKSSAKTGRVNLSAHALGVLRVDAERLAQLNHHDGITLATLPSEYTRHSRQNGGDC